jgi:hypothetical protein
MTGPRDDRLELALRRNRGRRLQADYLEDMQSRLGRHATGRELLDLPETDRIREALQERLEAMLQGITKSDTQAIGVDTDQPPIAEQCILDVLSLWRPAPEVFLLAPGSDVCGAVPTSASEVRRRRLELARDDEEAVLVGDRTGGSGLKLYVDTVAGHAPRRWSVLGWGAEVNARG